MPVNEMDRVAALLGLIAGVILTLGPALGATSSEGDQRIEIKAGDETNDIWASGSRNSIAPVTKDHATNPANPLWGITLHSLSETRERPIFAPSRRPPMPPAVVAPAPLPEPVSKLPEPDRPPLLLLGTIVGSSEGIAVFLDEATKTAIRLKSGEDHAGWILRSVGQREAVLERNQQTTTMSFPTRQNRPQDPGELAPSRSSVPPWLAKMLNRVN